MREIKLKFVFKHPESGHIIISRSYMIDELVDQDNLHTTYDIQDECCVCDCQPEGETNVVECNCSDYYDKFELIDRIEWSGILDKHGVEIYEGDICKVHQFLFDGNEVEHETIGVIGHSGTSFTLSEIRSKFIEEHTGHYSGEGEFPLVDFQPIDHLYGLHEESFEIIGNRFQHPELLNAK